MVKLLKFKSKLLLSTMALSLLAGSQVTFANEAPTWKPRSVEDVKRSLSVSEDTTRYTVEFGDTLGVIAKALDVDMNVLANINKITNVNVIYPGTVFKTKTDTDGEVISVKIEPATQEVETTIFVNLENNGVTVGSETTYVDDLTASAPEVTKTVEAVVPTVTVEVPEVVASAPVLAKTRAVPAPTTLPTAVPAAPVEDVKPIVETVKPSTVAVAQPVTSAPVAAPVEVVKPVVEAVKPATTATTAPTAAPADAIEPVEVSMFIETTAPTAAPVETVKVETVASVDTVAETMAPVETVAPVETAASVDVVVETAAPTMAPVETVAPTVAPVEEASAFVAAPTETVAPASVEVTAPVETAAPVPVEAAPVEVAMPVEPVAPVGIATPVETAAPVESVPATPQTVNLPNVSDSVNNYANYVADTYGVSEFSGHRPNDTDGVGTGHGDGLALDVMVPVGSDLGDAIATDATSHMADNNISYVIWEQQFYAEQPNIYGPANTWNPMPDRGSITQNHYDHVHVSFNS